MTIEGLRNRAFDALCRELSKKNSIPIFINGYIVGAQEQDRIARKEERERCIRIAQDTICTFCGYVICPNMKRSDCEGWKRLRKAMEGGEV